MRVFQEKKEFFAGILLVLVLLSGIWCSGCLQEHSFCVEQPGGAAVQEQPGSVSVSVQEQTVSAAEQEPSGTGFVRVQELSDGGLTLISSAFMGVLCLSEQESAADREESVERQTNRRYFISLSAILFKIAVIPGIILAVASATEQNTSAALCQTLCFVHASDGKKRRSFRFL